jgi:hypothetical protein
VVGSFILVVVVIAIIDASCFIMGCVVFVVAIVDPCNTVVVVVVFLVNDIIVITCGSFAVDSFGNGCLVVGSFVVVVVVTVVVVDYDCSASCGFVNNDIKPSTRGRIVLSVMVAAEGEETMVKTKKKGKKGKKE